MSFLHCMTCFTFHNSNTKFYISSCLHVACINCVQKGAFTLKCKICQKENPQCHEIGSGLKKEFRELFTSMADSVKEINTTISQVLQFQTVQRRMLLSQLYNRFENFEKMRQFCEESVKKKNEYKTQIVQLQQYNSKATQHIQCLQDKLVEITKKDVQPSGASHLNLTAMTHDPFRTPAPRGSYRSFITSTPCENTTIGPERISTTDATLSFSAAMGLPKSLNSTDGDVTILANRTECVNLNCTNTFKTPNCYNGGTKRSVPRTHSSTREIDKSSTNYSFMLTPNTSRDSGIKKFRMDMLARTDPLHK